MRIPHRGLVLAAAVAVAAALPVGRAEAGEIVLGNNGFEQDLSGWRQSFGTGGISASSERAYSGSKSAKIVDGSAAGSVGLESGFATVTGGTAYGVQARVSIASGGASLYLRWYNAQNVLLGSTHSTVTGPTSGWTTLRTTITIPEGAEKATALLYAPTENVGTTYWDDIAFSRKIADLGTQIINSAFRGATFGQGSDQHHIYAAFDGNYEQASRLGVIDANTGSVEALHNLPGSVNGWGATTASDGSVFVGTNSSGNLYRYSPATRTVTNLGKTDGQNFIWTLDAGTDGKVYGGTFAKGGGTLFKWEPGNGFSTIPWRPTNDDWPVFEYVRAVAYDSAHHVTYLSVGSGPSELVRFDNSTGAVQKILPEVFGPRGMLGNLEWTGERLFAGGRVLSFTEQAGRATVTQDAVISGGRLSPAAPARGSSVYLVRDNGLIRYDINAKTVTPVGHSTGFSVSKLGWVRLSDQDTYPGETLVGLGDHLSKPWMFRYNPTHNTFTQQEVGSRPITPTIVRSLATGPDGKIYTGGYLSGAVGVYTPFAGDTNDSRPEQQFLGLNQGDSILTHGTKMYFGTYSGAHIFEYDPSRPWDRDQGGTNPRELPLGLVGLSVPQDRPYALAAGDGKLFVGTVPGYGWNGGALGVYDLAGNATLATHVNLVQGHSITALAYHQGLVFGGTSVAGGIGSKPAPGEAKLFVYNPATRTKVAEYALPVRGLSEITALQVVDGQLWGFAEGRLFVFDPVSRRYTHQSLVFDNPAFYQEPKWADARLITRPGDTDAVFATIGGRQLLRIDRDTKDAVVLTSVAANLTGLAADRDGHLYYAVGSRLHRYLR